MTQMSMPLFMCLFPSLGSLLTTLLCCHLPHLFPWPPSPTGIFWSSSSYPGSPSNNPPGSLVISCSILCIFLSNPSFYHLHICIMLSGSWDWMIPESKESIVLLLSALSYSASLIFSCSWVKFLMSDFSCLTCFSSSWEGLWRVGSWFFFHMWPSQ